MSGSEQPLLAAIASGLGVHVKNRAPDPNNEKIILEPGQPWPAGDSSSWRGAYPRYASGAIRGSSDNWGPDSIAAQLLLGNVSEKSQADIWGIEELTAQKTQYGFMRQETGSVTYGYMHLMAVLVMFKLGSDKLRELSGEWLDLWRYWLVTTYDARVNRVLWIGKRSAEGGRDQRNIMDDLAAWFVGSGTFPAGRGTLDYLIIEALQPQLTAVKARPIANPQWKMDGTVDIYVGDDGIAVCVSPDDDSNTPAILGASTVGSKAGTYNGAPAAPYFNRIREQGTGATCVISEDKTKLLYSDTSKLFPAVSLMLPRNWKRYSPGNGSTQPVEQKSGSSVNTVPTAAVNLTKLPSLQGGASVLSTPATKPSASKWLFAAVSVIVIVVIILLVRGC